ncbi:MULTISPECIES: hypothetical protein [unclassified Bradyrhizobium]|uniref:hypothetical protein n=1 Tax=unclassified Bradyrhizobium TaxID=2631580 RepID=UPI0012EBCC57|nr:MULTISPECIES: hypothetical protein [unclassified Bradyrhizobium]QIG91963.1 hypothetical protein G6P99_05240 [Bradyrhizobium sp. 6(2017)]
MAPPSRDTPRRAFGPWRCSPATVLVFCVGCSHHNARLKLADLPDWDWYDISAHLNCTACGKVGWVDTGLDWSEVIDFAKGVFG